MDRNSKSDLVLHVPTHKGEFWLAKDAHLIFEHVISSYLFWELGNESG